MKKFLNWLKSPSSDFILFILLLILANIAGNNSFKRFDLTGPDSYSLSKGSKSIVKNIEEPLTIRVFFDDNLPSPYNSVAQYVKDILVEYKGAANKNLSVIYMDMSKEDSQDLAMDFGLRQIQIQEVKNNEVGLKQVYMGIVLAYGDNIQVIDGLTATDGLEYKITSKISKMIDTADTLAALSDEDKINVVLYMSDALKALRISGTDQAEKIIKAAVDNVNRKNLNKLDFRTVSPAEGETKGLVNTYGIQEITYQDENGQRDSAVLGLVLEHGDDFRVLPVKIQQSFFGYAVGGLENAETDISSALQSLISKATEIGYVTGHKEMDRTNQETGCQNFDSLISQNYSVVDLDLSKDDIPAGMNSVIINGSSVDYTEEELYKIDQFVMRGGNLLVFLDSMVEDPSSQTYYQQGSPTYMANNNNLDRLLQNWGIERKLNMVMDTNCYSEQNRQYGPLNFYWVPVLQKEQLASKSVITKNLAYVYMLQNGSIDVSKAQENKELKVTVLAKSSDKAWTEEHNLKLNPLLLEAPSDKDKLGSQNLLVLAEGKFNSAFDGPLENSSDGGISASNFIAKGTQSGKVFVCNSSQITTRQVIDDQGNNPVAMLLLNVIDYCNGNGDFCLMRSKNLGVNPLTVKNQAFANLCKLFNEFGLTVLVAIAGFIVWRCRSRRRKAINAKYNPDDTRTISK